MEVIWKAGSHCGCSNWLDDANTLISLAVLFGLFSLLIVLRQNIVIVYIFMSLYRSPVLNCLYFCTQESSFEKVSSWLPYLAHINPAVQILVCQTCRQEDGNIVLNSIPLFHLPCLVWKLSFIGLDRVFSYAAFFSFCLTLRKGRIWLENWC